MTCELSFFGIGYQVALREGDDSVTMNTTRLQAGGSLFGGAGEDRFFVAGQRTRDFIVGNDGSDLVSYEGRTEGVIVTATSGYDDGRNGAEDRIHTDVERVVGTDFADSITAPNASAPSRLFGLGGNDALIGTIFADTIDGGAQVDVLTAGDGADEVVGRERSGQVAVRDSLNCGAGSDTAFMDLLDISLGCENRQIAAIDEGGILSVVSRSLRRRRDGHVAVRLHCPLSSKTRCNGRLTLSRRGRRLGSARYRIAKGQRRTVRVAVPAGVGGTVLARAVEPDSRRRPKTTEKRLQLR